MRILIDGRLYGLENAGLGRYLVNLVAELSKLDLKNEYVILLRKKYFESLTLPANWEKVLADIRHYSLAEQIKLPSIIKKEKPDLVHFPHFNVPLFYKGKFVVTIHDMLMHKSRGIAATTLPSVLYFIKRLAYRFVFDYAVRRSEKILVPSRAVKDEIFKTYHPNQEKIEVTYEGFDEKIQGSSLENLPKPYFVYAGNAYPHKNLGSLIQAIKLLNTKSKQSLASQSPGSQKIFLAIASARNIFTQRIEKQISEANAGEFVKMLGFVPDEKLGGLFKNSVGFVFPSFSEGFGLPGLEALASGTLLLASDIKVFKEIYGDCALYFNPRDVSSIANALKMAMSIGVDDRKRKIVSSIEFVKKYSWVKMAKETLEVYVKSCNSIRQGK